ncbi:MAG: hypothetical protein IT359_19975 [Gemmatimonadaceae bacterium]|nr:hypothetical protein [Gemmatimonadaceae bacterium]
MTQGITMRLIPLLCGMTLSGCADGAASVGSAPPPTISSPSVVARVEGDCVTNEPCELRVIVSSSGGAIGAYQGRLHLDPHTVRIVTRPTSRDAAHLVNGELTESYELRFAGFSPAGEGRVEAVAVKVVLEQPDALRSIRAALDVVADAAGTRISPESIQSETRIQLR